MNAKELETKQSILREKIFDVAKSNGLAIDDSINAIPDGVADCERYIKSSPRVAWVLKESYDTFKEDGITPSGGGWLLYEGFMGENKDWTKNITWQRIIYTMFGLRYGKHYNEMDYIRNKPEMGDVMKETVILNLSKMPAGTTSSFSFANQYEQYWRPILKEQVELYNPQVIVFGNTFGSCWPLFVPEDSEPIRITKDGRCFINLYKTDDRILLDAYHPGLRSDIEFYVNSIIDTINDCFPSSRRV